MRKTLIIINVILLITLIFLLCCGISIARGQTEKKTAETGNTSTAGEEIVQTDGTNEEENTSTQKMSASTGETDPQKTETQGVTGETEAKEPTEAQPTAALPTEIEKIPELETENAPETEEENIPETETEETTPPATGDGNVGSEVFD